MKTKITVILTFIILTILTLSVSAQESVPFEHHSDDTITVIRNGNEYTLYRTMITIDFNGDGKCSAYEAREMLRMASGLTTCDTPVSALDLNGDSRLTPADARYVLRFAARLDIYYTTENFKAVSGFSSDPDGHTHYFTENGIMAVGLTEIDGELYYFANGIMSTGLVSANGKYYYFDESGKGTGGRRTIDGKEYLFCEDGSGYSGDYTENGKQYYYNGGTLYTGWLNQNGVVRYYKDDGAMAVADTMIDGMLYGFNSEGMLQNGLVSKDGKTYYYNNGIRQTGWQTIHGKRYYFNSDGSMAKNKTVDHIILDSSGVAVAADKSFFDDAVFIGDSVSVALMNYQKNTKALGNAQVYAASSLSAANALWSVSSQSVHPYYNGKKTLIEDCVRYSGAKKVFIMLGMNDIGIYSFDTSIRNYKELVSRIKAKSPKVEIYIQSMTPMTSISTRADGKLNNTNIKQYNARLQAMCKEMGWHYVNVASALYDSTGTYLPTAYCSDPVYMGLHLSNEGCKQWVAYLLKNAAFL